MSFLNDLITMIIVVNPFSKMLVSATITKEFTKDKVREIINYSNLIALALITFFAIFGPLIFKQFLGISNSALNIACGLSLGIFGVSYLFKDEIFNVKKNVEVMYLSIGTPLIVGPASITAITIISSYSTILYSLLISTLAIILNYILMVFSTFFLKVTEENKKLQYIATRVTGLFMLAVGVQFVINGLKLLTF
ncbi:MarC family integral membrane protein [Candidatus Tiddalikarchaeum anstoanum]|nr:MarC family integral membrane protein [Candidatus Tiddalikarchaeum anstoanum]